MTGGAKGAGRARDAERLAVCLEDTLRFAREGAVADMVEAIRFPDPAKGGTREDFVALARRFSGSGYHPCGTVKMGPAEDAGAVVDPGGRCHGVDGLVVADASIMPFVPRANTNLTCFMIGEQVGEWIRTRPQDYGM